MTKSSAASVDEVCELEPTYAVSNATTISVPIVTVVNCLVEPHLSRTPHFVCKSLEDVTKSLTATDSGSAVAETAAVPEPASS
jgi:hypothetical protein